MDLYLVSCSFETGEMNTVIGVFCTKEKAHQAATNCQPPFALIEGKWKNNKSKAGSHDLVGYYTTKENKYIITKIYKYEMDKIYYQ